MSSWDKYYSQSYQSGLAALDEESKKRKKNTEETLAKADEIIDKGADQATAGYRKSQEQAPLDALEQKEDNALREAVNRKIVEENMANMGLTDSGLNRTQLTALTLQRGNADAKVDQQTQAIIQELQFRIDAIYSEAEQKKQENRLNAEQEHNDWYTAATLTVEENAKNYATQMYKADQEAYAAQVKADQDRRNNVQSYIAKRMADGVSYARAAVEAYAIYGSGNANTDEYSRNYVSVYQRAVDEGYDEKTAESIASLVSNDVSYENAVAKAMDTTGLVSWDDRYANWFTKLFGDDYDNYSNYETPADKWTPQEWETGIVRMANSATERVSEKYNKLDGDQQNYLAAKAVVEMLLPAMLRMEEADPAISALYTRFSENTVNEVLADFGIGIENLSTSESNQFENWLKNQQQRGRTTIK